MSITKERLRHVQIMRKLRRAADAQPRIYAQIRASEEAKRAERHGGDDAVILTVLVLIVVFFIVIKLNADTQPEMYLTERACITKHESAIMGYVGVSPNPTQWGRDDCEKYGEPTFRINPEYLEWVKRQPAETALAEEPEEYLEESDDVEYYYGPNGWTPY